MNKFTVNLEDNGKQFKLKTWGSQQCRLVYADAKKALNISSSITLQIRDTKKVILSNDLIVSKYGLGEDSILDVFHGITPFVFERQVFSVNLEDNGKQLKLKTWGSQECTKLYGGAKKSLNVSGSITLQIRDTKEVILSNDSSVSQYGLTEDSILDVFHGVTPSAFEKQKFTAILEDNGKQLKLKTWGSQQCADLYKGAKKSLNISDSITLQIRDTKEVILSDDLEVSEYGLGEDSILDVFHGITPSAFKKQKFTAILEDNGKQFKLKTWGSQQCADLYKGAKKSLNISDSITLQIRDTKEVIPTNNSSVSQYGLIEGIVLDVFRGITPSGRAPVIKVIRSNVEFDTAEEAKEFAISIDDLPKRHFEEKGMKLTYSLYFFVNKAKVAKIASNDSILMSDKTKTIEKFGITTKDPAIRQEEQHGFGTKTHKQFVILQFTFKEAIEAGFTSPKTCLLSSEFSSFANFSHIIGKHFKTGSQDILINKAAINDLKQSGHKFSFDKMFKAMIKAVDSMIDNKHRAFKSLHLKDVLEVSGTDEVLPRMAPVIKVIRSNVEFDTAEEAKEFAISIDQIPRYHFEEKDTNLTYSLYFFVNKAKVAKIASNDSILMSDKTKTIEKFGITTKDPAIRQEEQHGFGTKTHKQFVILQFTFKEAIKAGFTSPRMCLLSSEFSSFANFSHIIGKYFETGTQDILINKAAINDLKQSGHKFSFDKMFKAMIKAVDSMIGNKHKEFKSLRLKNVLELSGTDEVSRGKKRRLNH